MRNYNYLALDGKASSDLLYEIYRNAIYKIERNGLLGKFEKLWFLPDGIGLLTASTGGFKKNWEQISYDDIARLTIHPKAVSWYRFGGMDGTALLTDIGKGAAQEAVANLTALKEAAKLPKGLVVVAL